MYAIVEAGGKQYRVAEGSKVVVDRMDAEIGSTVVLDRILLLGGEKAIIGTPLVPGASVTATVADHPRGDKIQVFKKRRRQGSKSLKGHRQDYTTLTVTGVSVSLGVSHGS